MAYSFISGCSGLKNVSKINFPIVLSRLSVLKLITEVSMSCILCCKSKNDTSMYAITKQTSAVFVFSLYVYVGIIGRNFTS